MRSFTTARSHYFTRPEALADTSGGFFARWFFIIFALATFVTTTFEGDKEVSTGKMRISSRVGWRGTLFAPRGSNILRYYQDEVPDLVNERGCG